MTLKKIKKKKLLFPFPSTNLIARDEALLLCCHTSLLCPANAHYHHYYQTVTSTTYVTGQCSSSAFEWRNRTDEELRCQTQSPLVRFCRGLEAAPSKIISAHRSVQQQSCMLEGAGASAWWVPGPPKARCRSPNSCGASWGPQHRSSHTPLPARLASLKIYGTSFYKQPDIKVRGVR